MEVKINEEDLKDMFNYITKNFTTERCGYIDNEGNIKETTNYLASTETSCVVVHYNIKRISWHCHPIFGVCPSIQDFIVALQYSNEIVFTAFGYWIIHFPEKYLLTNIDEYNALSGYFYKLTDLNPTQEHIESYIYVLEHIFQHYNLKLEFVFYKNMSFENKRNNKIANENIYSLLPIPLIYQKYVIPVQEEIIGYSLSEFDNENKVDLTELYNLPIYLDSSLSKNIKTDIQRDKLLEFIKYYSRNLQYLKFEKNLILILENAFKNHLFSILNGTFKKQDNYYSYVKFLEIQCKINLFGYDDKITILLINIFYSYMDYLDIFTDEYMKNCEFIKLILKLYLENDERVLLLLKSRSDEFRIHIKQSKSKKLEDFTIKELFELVKEF